MPSVIIPHTVVTVDGVVVPTVSVKVTREIATDLPAAVTGGGGLVAATATVEWGTGTRGVLDRSFITPRPGARVVIKRGTGGADGLLTTAFTGAVDETTGSASQGDAVSTLVDDVTLLDRTVTIPTHMSREVSGVGVTSVELSSAWLAYDIVRQCGLSAYHYSPATTAVWASLGGSILPSVGPIPGYLNDTQWDPAATPNGVGVRIAPGKQVEFGMDPLTTNGAKSVEFSIWADPGQPDYTYIGMSGYSVAFGHRGPTVYIGNGLVGLTGEDGGVIGSLPATGWQPIAFFATWTASGWVYRLRVGTAVLSPAVITQTGASTRASSEKWQVTIGRSASATNTGLIAGYVFDRLPGTVPVWAEHNYTPRFVYTTSAGGTLAKWECLPGMDAENGLDLLRRAAAAELAGLWLDEDGVLQYRSRWKLRDGATFTTLTAKASLIDFNWRDSLAGLRSRVVVKWRRPATTVRDTYTIPVWSPESEQTIKTADGTSQWFAEPDENTDWLDPDWSFRIGSSGVRGIGSWWAGTVKKTADNATVRTATTADVYVSGSALGKRKGNVTVTASSDVGSLNYVALQGPKVMARGVCKWADVTTVVTSTLSPSSAAPELLHDVGYFLQTTEQATAVGLDLANLTAKPLIQIDDIKIQPHPYLRLGTRVTLSDNACTGLTVDGVIFRMDEDWSASDASMAIGLRVLSATKGTPTLDDFDRRWANSTLAQFDSLWQGKTLAALDAAPLT